MKKALTKFKLEIYHYVDGKRVEGAHDLIFGDVSGISGDASEISGNVSGISGDVSGLSGNVSGIRGNVCGISGDVSGIMGNFNNCELTDEERKAGVNIEDLIG